MRMRSLSFLVVLTCVSTAWGEEGITYTDVSEDAGITFSRVPSPRQAAIDEVNAMGAIPQAEFFGVVRPNSPPIRVYLDNQRTLEGGTLAVEVSSADNGNGWAEIRTRGSIGTIPGGSVNRDGIGAVVRFTPEGGKTSIRQIVGGSSYGSQDSLAASFGLGQAKYGSVEVLWPGGVTNRLANVRPGERIVFPEIPCDYATRGDDPDGYQACVDSALADLGAAGVLDAAEAARFRSGAFSCQPGPTTLCLDHQRFSVGVDWSYGGQSGAGYVGMTEKTAGAFYFFNPNTIELHANVLDGCDINDHYWVFAAASSTVEFTLWITDGESGETLHYRNPEGTVPTPVTDVAAFSTCP